VLGADQRCAGTGVPESTPAGVRLFQQDQDWIFFIRTGAGVVFNTIFLTF